MIQKENLPCIPLADGWITQLQREEILLVRARKQRLICPSLGNMAGNNENWEDDLACKSDIGGGKVI